MSIYLAPEQSRWTPQTEGDLRLAIEMGLLGETHHLDMKREVGQTAGERKETARDLCSFALDGGALIVGIEEDKPNRVWVLKPQALPGLAERIEQIATQVIDPPLFTVATEIPSEADPLKGYLLVHIPPSPTAPHMVDGVYYGRGDRTRIRLSDAQVVRHHSRRESVEDLGGHLLDEEMRRDPVLSEFQQQGHLYVISQPLTARRDLARVLVRDRADELFALINGAEGSLPRVVRDFAPAPGYATRHARRAKGTGWCSSEALVAGRSYSASDDEEDLLDIELREDGGIRILMGRMTAVYGAAHPERVIADGLAVAYARRVVAWSSDFGQRTGYHGSWVFGVAATRLRGHRSAIWRQGFGSRGTTYDAADYREITTAPDLEMRQQPWRWRSDSWAGWYEDSAPMGSTARHSRHHQGRNRAPGRHDPAVGGAARGQVPIDRRAGHPERFGDLLHGVLAYVVHRSSPIDLRRRHLELRAAFTTAASAAASPSSVSTIKECSKSVIAASM